MIVLPLSAPARPTLYARRALWRAARRGPVQDGSDSRPLFCAVPAGTGAATQAEVASAQHEGQEDVQQLAGGGGGGLSISSRQRAARGKSSLGAQPEAPASGDTLPENAKVALSKLGEVSKQQPVDVEAVALHLGQLAAILRGASAKQLQGAKGHPALAAALAVLPAVAPAAPPAQLAAALQACAHLQLKMPREGLEALGAAVGAAVPAAHPADTVRSAWALSRLGFCAPVVLAAMEARVAAGPSWLEELEVEGLASLLWVCKRASHTAGHLVPAAVEALGRAAAEGGQGGWQGQISGQQLSLTLYSCAAMRHRPSKAVLEQLCGQALRAAASFTPQGFANVAWSLGRLEHHDPALMEALAKAALPKLHQFSHQELTLLASGFAGVSHRHEALLTAIAKQMASSSAPSTPRDHSHLLSSLARLGVHPGEEVLAEIDRRTAELLRKQGLRPAAAAARRGKRGGSGVKQASASQPDAAAAAAATGKGDAAAAQTEGGPGYPADALCWCLWALAKLGYRPRALLRGLDEAWGRAPVRLYELGPEDAGRLMWALAKLDHRPGAVLDELALVLRRLLPSMPPQSLAMVLHGYASLCYTPHELLDGAAEHLAAKLSSYPPQSVTTLIWAFGRLGVHPGRGLPGGGTRTEDGKPLLEAVEAYAVAHAAEMVTPGIATLCWGLATLHHHPGYDFVDAMATQLTQQAQHAQQGRGHGQEQQSGAEGGALGHDEADSLQALSLVAWAFAQWGHHDMRLHAAIRGCLLPPGTPAPQQVLDSMDGSVHFQPPGGPEEEEGQQAQQPGQQAGQVQQAGGEAAAADCQGDWAPPAIFPATASNLAFALAKQGLRDPALVHTIRQAAETSLGRYNAQELTNLLWCHAALEVQPPVGFLDGAVTALRPQLAGCDASLVALAVHSLAVLRYVPPDDWMEAAVRCVSEALHEEEEEEEEEEEPPVGEAEQHRIGQTGAAAPQMDSGIKHSLAPAAAAAAAAAAPHAQQPLPPQQGKKRRGGKGGRRPRRAPASVHISLQAKLLWACAYLGYEPPAGLLQPILDSSQWALSHDRSRTTVLPAVELVRLLWALAMLEQYGTSLYRNLSFRVSKLPWGVPKHPDSVQLLRQVVMLSNSEARFVSVPLRGNSLLPEWLREAAPASPADEPRAAGMDGEEAECAGGAARKPELPQLRPSAASAEGKRAAEALAEALLGAGCKPVGARQLLYGDWVVVYRFRDSGQAAVMPYLPQLRATNEGGKAVGSALATLRVLAAKGFPVVLGSHNQAATVTECLDLWT